MPGSWERLKTVFIRVIINFMKALFSPTGKFWGKRIPSCRDCERHTKACPQDARGQYLGLDVRCYAIIHHLAYREEKRAAIADFHGARKTLRAFYQVHVDYHLFNGEEGGRASAFIALYDADSEWLRGYDPSSRDNSATWERIRAAYGVEGAAYWVILHHLAPGTHA